MTTYVAIDIGASSGRLMQSEKTAAGTMSLTEVHRFKNGFAKVDELNCWQIEQLINEILRGFAKLKKNGVNTCYVGIDTWGVDYCLIDRADRLIQPPVSYRDDRTTAVLEPFFAKWTKENLYQKTGIQIQPFNTVFQLFSEEREKLAQAAKILLIPDYLGYVFTGQAVLEQTNASTTQLMNMDTKELDEELLQELALEAHRFAPLVEPGHVLGPLLNERFPEYDLPELTFITVASHDTASAVVGTPGVGDEWAFISSGTWSLIGTELAQGNKTAAAFENNFTNEWGIEGTTRFLKNIMGMWLIQEVARIQNYRYSYAELAHLAQQEPGFVSLINVNEERFLNPVNMINEIQQFCEETQQPIPQTAGEVARCIYDSLACCYALELLQLEKVTNKTFTKLYIVGGGSNNDFLNQLTANVCQLALSAGPSEATAIGNLVVQMLATNELTSLATARKWIGQSFDLKEFQPEIAFDYQGVLKHYQSILEYREEEQKYA
ncbi:MAG: rhamnulokinase [Enterococcus sp.]